MANRSKRAIKSKYLAESVTSFSSIKTYLVYWIHNRSYIYVSLCKFNLTERLDLLANDVWIVTKETEIIFGERERKEFVIESMILISVRASNSHVTR